MFATIEHREDGARQAHMHQPEGHRHLTGEDKRGNAGESANDDQNSANHFQNTDCNRHASHLGVASSYLIIDREVQKFRCAFFQKQKAGDDAQ